METDTIPVDPDASVLPPDLRAWVAAALADGMPVEQARVWLGQQGWSRRAVDVALRQALAEHRPERGPGLLPPKPASAHQHRLAYSVLLWSLGLGALALGSSLHLILAAAFLGRSGSWVLADWLTLFFCTVPFFAYAEREVRKIERDDPLARLSRTRERLTLVLLWAAALVGVARLLVFVHQTLTALLVERTFADLPQDLAHVSTVVLIAGGVFLWTWRFRHAGVPAATRG